MTGEASRPKTPEAELNQDDSSPLITPYSDPEYEDIWSDDEHLSLFDNLLLALINRFPLHAKETMQAKRNDWSKRLDDTYANLLKRAKLDKDSRERFQKKIKLVEQREKMARKWQEKNVVRLRDKVSFVMGVSNIFAVAYLVGRIPSWLPEWYTFWAISLVLLRFVIYKTKAWHYFVFDLCYFVNVLVIFYLWVFPQNNLVFSAAFCLSHGPLLWAVVAWRNSLVFHSLDKVTSTFIHIAPPFTLYTIRWLIPANAERMERYGSYANQQKNDGVADPVGFITAMWFSVVLYIVWQSLYYIFILVGRKEKVFQGKRVTSVTWLLDDTKSKISQTASVFGDKYKVYTFMGMQLVYAIITMLPTVLLYHYFWLHTVFLLGISLISLWNGSTYYFDVFSKQYVKELEELNDEIKRKDLENRENLDKA
ncbi:hypothetical protein K7432_007777 [Basidiobolus ranarum]|uniref:Glycerophosphocholine acyltransferase 1 n=1 Tax=Basidiobolus ranarum TaxID=34480 RepID=A0ABR2VZP1_9FUNG